MILNNSKKGQTSIEVLAILGILIIGGVILGSFYLSSINKRTSAVSEIDAASSNWLDYNGGMNIDYCGDGICQSHETTDTCPEDCKGGGSFCGDGTCDTGENYSNCPKDCSGPSGLKTVELENYPNPVIHQQDFTHDLNLEVDTDHEELIVEISIEKNNIYYKEYTPFSDCYYNGTQINSGTHTLNSDFNESDSGIKNYTFKCDNTDTADKQLRFKYYFDSNADISAEADFTLKPEVSTTNPSLFSDTNYVIVNSLDNTFNLTYYNPNETLNTTDTFEFTLSNSSGTNFTKDYIDINSTPTSCGIDSTQNNISYCKFKGTSNTAFYKTNNEEPIEIKIERNNVSTSSAETTINSIFDLSLFNNSPVCNSQTSLASGINSELTLCILNNQDASFNSNYGDEGLLKASLNNSNNDCIKSLDGKNVFCINSTLNN